MQDEPQSTNYMYMYNYKGRVSGVSLVSPGSNGVMKADKRKALIQKIQVDLLKIYSIAITWFLLICLHQTT